MYLTIRTSFVASVTEATVISSPETESEAAGTMIGPVSPEVAAAELSRWIAQTTAATSSPMSITTSEPLTV
jgi:hypothetical protein